MSFTIEQLKNVDVRTVDRETLVDIKTVVVNPDLPQLERMVDFVRQVKNPFCYIHRIFVLACDGLSNTSRGAHSAASSRTYWTREGVRKMLIDERYVGVMVSGKRRISSPGSRVDEKLSFSDLSEIVIIPLKAEAQKTLDMQQKHEQQVRFS